MKAARSSAVGSLKLALGIVQWVKATSPGLGQREMAAGIVQWVSASLIVKARARSSMVRASGS